MAVDLSIVIVNYKVRELLRACLRSLPAATEGLETEVFVVDNASDDGSVEMIREAFPEVRLTASAENLGFTRGNNVAIRDCVGRYVLLLNPDTEPEPGSLARLVQFMEAHPRAGACGPKLLNTDGTLQHNGRRFPTLWRELLAVTGVLSLTAGHFERALTYGRDDFDVECEVDQVSGACILARRSVIEAVGMLDERFFMFYEEVEWCHRVRAAGWEVWYVPESRVTHHWMGSVSQNSHRMTAELLKSQVLYYQKTDGPLAAVAARGIMGLGLLKNDLLHLGAAVKRVLRRFRLVR
jgi:N-acetylglucosaminyl-diphospho-decaprenol L-rhamnosyltransferase